MADDSQIRLLVEELLESNRTPEEVCADTPELVPAVRKRLEQVQRLGYQLDEMFGDDVPTRRGSDAIFGGDGDLPIIRGYEVESVLGRGGMGVVFKARHVTLNRVVALKMMLGGLACPEELARFRREAEAVAGLRHANIVQVYDMGEFQGRPYFTMEYVEGGSLAQRLTGTPLGVRFAAELVATLAEAMQVAHQGGIVHRDLKPGNILLQRKAESTADSPVHAPLTNFDPKIADFGLARPFEQDSELTRSGARVGTPSYMAPEQAMGKSRAIGPPVDIYSLGAVLYELLTGRPPFRGETATETELQVIQHDPVRPSRLNPRVPRDLETICLKCLQKAPERRYATALALADDLQRFLRGEPITARRPGLPERLVKWVRRRPTFTGLLAASLLFTIAIVGIGLWLAVDHAKRRQGVEGDLREVAGLLQQAQWDGARATLQRAEARLDGGGAADLRAQIDQAQRDLDLVIELDRIRLSRLTSGNLSFYKTKADQDYAKAFRDAGLGKDDDPPSAVAERVRASAVRGAVIAALDDWATCATRERRNWLVAATRLADPDPQGWRGRIRDTATWDDAKALAQLAETAPVTCPSVALLLALAERLTAVGGNPIPFLKRVQKEHPANFWANMVLGDALFRIEPVEAAGYFRAALAARPAAAVAYTALGDSLRTQKRKDEALAYYNQALQMDPNYARGHTNLGNLLHDDRKWDEAIACYRRALKIDPHYAWAHLDLANTLRDLGRADEALEHYKQFHAIDPSISYVANTLRSDLVRRGRGEEARLEWKKSLEANPPQQHDAWFGYAELCLFLENEDEYRLARKDLLRRFGATEDLHIAERTARAVLLRPVSPDELRVAVELTDRALAAKPRTEEWIYPYFLFAKGLAEYREGKFEQAVKTMNSSAAKVMGPCPRFVVAMSKHRLGDKKARTMLADAIAARDWKLPEVRSHDQWIWHVLRREAENMIFPDTAAFLVGKHQPRDNVERIGMVGVCEFKNRTGALTKLYADAFAADAKLADSKGGRYRYKAACAAALAGTGVGSDAGSLNEAERAQFRKLAHAWLECELDLAQKRMQSASAESRQQQLKTLKAWQSNPDFSGVRDLATLPAAEREKWLTLWRDVATLVSPMP